MSQFSGELKRFFFEDEHPHPVTLGDVLKLGDQKIFGFLLTVFSFPCALPIPHFGLSFPLGLILIVFALQFLFGKHTPWLPKRLVNYPLRMERARKIITVGLTWIERLEAIAKPRWSYICTSVTGRIIIGAILVITGLVMAIPVPGTNLPPALGIFVTGIGLLEEDGLTCLIGLGISLAAVALGSFIIGALFVGGTSMFDWMHTWIPM